MSTLDDYVITGTLNVFDQLALARKLAPALPLVDLQLKDDNKDKPKALLVVIMLSQLSDTDSTFVIGKCLSVVMRKQENGSLAKVVTKDGVLLFDDITMTDLLELTSKVIEANLGDFLRTALTDSAQ